MKVLHAVLVSVFLLPMVLAGPVRSMEIGELDATFGEDGRVATAVGHYEDQAYAVTVQADGKILVAGSSSNGANLDFAIVRYNQDGTLDQTFNLDGTVTTQIGQEDDEVAAIAVQEDGYIVAAGYSVTNGSRDFALARYTPDGMLDHSFGLGGIIVSEYGSLDDEITALAIDQEGRLVVAGYSTGTAGRAVVVARYLASGVLDLGFGDEGLSLTGIGEDAVARSIDMDNQGRVVVAGSYYHADQTQVMVLRFTEYGELDNEFGLEGLAVPSYTQTATEGFGVTVHESGAILVAGSVGEPGEFDAALFQFAPDGQPNSSFGDNGVLVTVVSPEDDMAMAVDVQGDIVCLSGFASVNGVREFLFISHQVEIFQPESVSFTLRTGSSTTGLRINERQVADSYQEYQPAVPGSMIPLQTIVNTTPFGYFSNDISYAVAVQPDGRAVAAGLSDQDGVISFAVARYGASAALDTPITNSAGVSVNWIVTKEPFEVTRTGAFTGGVIDNSGNTIAKRGVVYSIAPDPVLKDGGTDTTDPTDPGGGGSSAPSLSNPTPTGTLAAGTTEVIIGLTTNESATCRYATTGGISYDSMTNNFVSTDGIIHEKLVTGLENGQSYSYYARCRDSEGNTNSSDFTISFSVATARTAGLIRTGQYAGAITNLLVGTAHAQSVSVDTGTTTTTTDNTTTSGNSVFDLSSPEYIIEGQTEEGAGTGSFSSILKDLKPGTFYYVRAYAITSGGDIYYGNQAGFKTADSCFIATAAYGSLFHPFVTVLRDFRDQYLVKTWPGRYFVRSYYRLSPPVADFISSHPALRPVVQVALLPVVGLGWLILHFGASTFLVIGVLGLGAGLVVHRPRHRA